MISKIGFSESSPLAVWPLYTHGPLQPLGLLEQTTAQVCLTTTRLVIWFKLPSLSGFLLPSNGKFHAAACFRKQAATTPLTLVMIRLAIGWAFRIAEPSCMHICLPAAVLRGVGNSLNLIIMLKARWHLKKFFCSGSPRVRRCGCICNRVGVVLYVTGTTRPIRSPVD